MSGDHTANFDPYCFAWPTDDSIVTTTPKAYSYKTCDITSHQCFYIKIHAELTSPPAASQLLVDDDDGDFLLVSGQDTRSDIRPFLVPCHLLEYGDNSSWWLTMSEILSTIGVPMEHQPFIIRSISICATQMVYEPTNLGRKILPMVVSFSSILDDQQDHDMHLHYQNLKEEDGTSLLGETIHESKLSVKAEEKRRFGFHNLMCGMLTMAGNWI